MRAAKAFFERRKPRNPMRAMHQNISVDSLPIGATLDAPIHDEQGVLLLDQGMELTAAFVQGLRTRGLLWVRIGASDSKPSIRGPGTARRSNNEVGSSLDRILEDVSRHLAKIGHSDKDKDMHRRGPYSPEAVRSVVEHIQQSAAELDGVLSDAETGRVVDIRGVQEVTAKTVIDVAEDTDVAVHSALQFNPDDELFREKLRTTSLQSTVLSLAIGLRLRMDATQLLHLGMAATLSDIGLMHQPDIPRIGKFVDTANDEHFWLSHPQRGFEQLTAIKTVPGPVLQAIRQHHELMDGTGFPFHLSDNRVCLAGRIIGVTQAFLALTSPLDGREGFLPADSVAYLIHHALEGRFCLRVMQAFVHATSIYPPGSMVELADQRTATVLRCSGKDFMRPIVQINGEAFDLRESQVRIAQPAATPSARQRRLPTRLLNEILW